MGHDGIDRDSFVLPPDRPPARRNNVALVLLLPIAVAAFAFVLYRAKDVYSLSARANAEDDALVEKVAALEKRIDRLEKSRLPVRHPRDLPAAGESEHRGDAPAQSQRPPATAKMPPALAALAPILPTVAATAPANSPASDTRPALPAAHGRESEERWIATADRLGSVVGELGSQSQEIARTQEDLVSLESRVERRQVGFALATNIRRQVGPVLLTLDRADVKNQRYTLRVSAGDTTTLLKDRAINEAVALYVEKYNAAVDLIITRLSKNQATGVLVLPAVPVVQAR